VVGWAKAHPDRSARNKDRVMILFMIITSVPLLDEGFNHLFKDYGIAVAACCFGA